jgi:hypothetical protein
MSTAQEIELMAKIAQSRLAAIARGFETLQRDMLTYGMHVAVGRNVGTVRARKLRRRGEDVRYVGRTETGKARYRWARRVHPFAIYKEVKA